MAISQRLRFEVLRRDNYTCRYCGASAPDVEITVDHVIPKALGGTDEPSNLCAACRRCNGGKTSSSPDAPLVADVAEDALHWARAMQAATARMLADLDAREADREQFRTWWNNWAYDEGDDRRTLPLESGWQQTVDQLVTAGLPLRILKECIDRAMSQRKVRDDQKFRYMCGVAWKKLTELQEAARAAAAGPESGNGTDDQSQYDTAIAYLLDFLTANAEERARSSVAEDEDQPAPGQYEQAVLEHAIIAATTDLQWLQSEVLMLLDWLPDGIGEKAQQSARISLYEEWGATFTKTQFIDRAVANARDLLDPQEVPF